MNVIYKYPIDKQTIMLPEGAEILHIGLQKDRPFVWAKVDPDEKTEKRFLFAFGTGQDIPEINMEYIKTLQYADDSLVIHIFKPL